jgi:prepilin-type N-terminal cleavage/methylation domain-containing protein
MLLLLRGMRIKLLNKKTNKNGFSLIEVMLGVAIILFVLVSGFMTLNVLTRASTSLGLGSKADRKLQERAEEIRLKAIGQFDTMDENGVDRSCPEHYLVMSPADKLAHKNLCTDVDRRIKVLSTIGPVNPLNRTRPVTLVAHWLAGNSISTRTLAFSVAEIRGKLAGGEITVLAKSALSPFNPIPKVKVTTQGQDLAQVTCLTNDVATPSSPLGTCVLKGVKLGTGVSVTFDGTLANHYFEGPNGPNAPGGTSTRAFDAGFIYSTVPVHIEASLYPPGKLIGRVFNIADTIPSTNGAPNVKLVFFAKQGTQSIPGHPYYEATSDGSNNGNFSVEVIPGLYSSHLIGNNEFAAEAAPGDMSDANRTFNTVQSGQSFNLGEWPSVKRGEINVQVQGISYLQDFTPQLGTVPSTTYPIIFGFITRGNTVYWEPSGQSVDWTNSVPWEQYKNFVRYNDPNISPNCGKNCYLSTRTIDSAGGISIPYYAPRIVRRPVASTWNLLDQYNLGEISMGGYQADAHRQIAPFTPVVIKENGTLATPIFFTSLAPYSYPVYGPRTPVGPTNFGVKIFTNETIRNPTQNYYLLETSAYANVRGRIITHDINGNVINFNPAGFSTSDVYIDYRTPGGYGLLVKELTTPVRTYLSYGIKIGTYIDTNFPGQLLFDYSRADREHPGSDPGGYNRVLPSFGGEASIFRYKCIMPVNTTQVNFLLPFRGINKTYDSGNNIIVTNYFFNFPSPLPNFLVNIYDRTAFLPTDTPIHSKQTAQLTNIQGTVTLSNLTVKKNDEFLGESVTPLIVTPRSDNPNHEIFVDATPVPNYYEHFIRPLNNDQWDFFWNESKAGPQFDFNRNTSRFEPILWNPIVYLNMAQRGVLNKIIGSCTNGFDSVEVLVSSGTPPSLLNAGRDLGADPTGAIDIPSVGFTMFPGTNIKLIVKQAGFVDAVFQTEGYDGMVWNIGTFSLQPNPITPIPAGIAGP